MALRMAQPFKHPRTGIYWFRRVVPKDLRALVGKREELATLDTKDLSEARVRYAKRSAEVESRWANLRKPPPVLSEREAHELAAAIHDEWIARYRDNPSEAPAWRTDLYAELWAPPTSWDLHRPMGERIRDLVDATFSPARKQEEWCVAEADRLLVAHGLRVDEGSRLKLARGVAGAAQRASLALKRAAQGDYGGLVQGSNGFPAAAVLRKWPDASAADTNVQQPPVPSAAILTLTGLMDAWWREAKAAGRKPSTEESYRNTIRSLIAFLRHDDATRVGPGDIVAFKDHRLSTPSPRTGRPPSAKTVKGSDLSALKTLFGWAVANHRLAVNPASGVTIKLGKMPRLRSKGFTDAEAQALLQAALAYQPGKEHPKTAAAKRWIPWLCAFTGARLGEIGQLRRQDIQQIDGEWVICITPEAGTVKTGDARQVVLHPQLIDLGFVRFSEACPEGPLFLTSRPSGDVLGPLQGLKNRIAEFSRRSVSDARVAPVHGWRHRFKTVGMDAGIEMRILDAIQGHAPRSMGEGYGDVSIKAQAEAIRKLTPFVLSDREVASLPGGN